MGLTGTRPARSTPLSRLPPRTPQAARVSERRDRPEGRAAGRPGRATRTGGPARLPVARTGRAPCRRSTFEIVACGWPSESVSRRGPQPVRRLAAQIRRCSAAASRRGIRRGRLEPATGGRRRDAEGGRGLLHRTSLLDRAHKRAATGKSELGISVQVHPGPPLSRESSQTHSLGTGPDDLSAVHNLCRQLT